MGAAMGIDKQDIMSRMEGFALQGVKGLFILLCFCFTQCASFSIITTTRRSIEPPAAYNAGTFSHPRDYQPQATQVYFYFCQYALLTDIRNQGTLPVNRRPKCNG